MRKYESQLNRALLDVLEETPGVTIYGLKEANRLEERVPTFAFNLKGFSPQQVAEELGKRDIYFRDGNYYALSVIEMLGVEASSSILPVGLVHHNKVEESDSFKRR